MSATLPRLPSFRLDGRRALVTGGTRGIGLGAAAALAGAGASVTVVARTKEEVTETARRFSEAGMQLDAAVLDVTDLDAMRAFVADREPFRILVNSAGGARHAAFLDVAETDFDAVMDLNLKAMFFLNQQVARRLVASGLPGSIINVSSQMGHVSGPRRSVYSASKFAVEGMTRAMAIELGPRSIRVNTVSPTFIETELTAKALADEDFRAWVLGKIKLGRLAGIEDIMGPILFLASDLSAMVTGTSLMVDGGWTAE